MRHPATVFGSILRRGRLSSGLTQARLANSVGVERQAVSQWEIGSRTPMGPMLAKLADTLPDVRDRLLAAAAGDLEDEVYSHAETPHLSRAQQRVARDSRSLRQVLDEGASLPRGSAVIVASHFGSKDAELAQVAEGAARNLLNGVDYVFVFPNEEPYEEAVSAILNQPRMRLDTNRPRFCLLEDVLSALKGDVRNRLERILADAAVVFDESAVAVDLRSSPERYPIRGYQYIEYYTPGSRPLSPDEEKHRFFLPIQKSSAETLARTVRRCLSRSEDSEESSAH